MMLEDLDPLLWAKRPRSQCAMDLLHAGVHEGDTQLTEIFSGHLRDGVCDDKGNLMMRWNHEQWRRVE